VRKSIERVSSPIVSAGHRRDAPDLEPRVGVQRSSACVFAPARTNPQDPPCVPAAITKQGFRNAGLTLLPTCPLLCGAVQPGQFMRHDDKRISGPAPSAYAFQAMLLQVPVRISVGYNRPWSSRATLRRVGLGSQEASSSFWISSYRAPRDIELGLSDHRHSLPWIAFASAFASVVRAIKIVRCLASRTLRTRLARPKAGKAMRLWHLRRSLKAAVTHIATKPPRE
jgi:hypothetical protein